MQSLPDIISDPAVLMDMPPSELGPVLLKLAKDRIQNGMVLLSHITEMPSTAAHHYPQHFRQQVNASISAAWDWLRNRGYIAPAPGLNGGNGWMLITKVGEQVCSASDLIRLRAKMAFPKELLHPKIADEVWAALRRNDLSGAAFFAFRQVEIEVREAGGYAHTDIGIALVRKAFDKNAGSLTDVRQPESERDALAHLFAGAIGSYKNPHSHRTVSLTDAREAQEQVLLASHLLSIVDARRKVAP